MTKCEQIKNIKRKIKENEKKLKILSGDYYLVEEELISINVKRNVSADNIITLRNELDNLQKPSDSCRCKHRNTVTRCKECKLILSITNGD